jgi:pilus assembly protein CpaF
MEGDVISISDIFTLELQGQDRDGRLFGKYHRSRVSPGFAPRLVYFGLDKAWEEVMAE